MDHFESVIHTLLEAEGYWVRAAYRVDLTKDQKRDLGKPSIPRPEIDLLALHVQRNEVLALEVKSYLDSPGVKLSELKKVHDTAEGRYKLFTSSKYRTVVLEQLRQQLLRVGAIDTKTSIRLGLAAGRVYKGQVSELRAILESANCFFLAPEEIRTRVMALSECAYQNNPTTIAAKIICRS
jgi:hypothetical protein